MKVLCFALLIVVSGSALLLVGIGAGRATGSDDIEALGLKIERAHSMLVQVAQIMPKHNLHHHIDALTDRLYDEVRSEEDLARVTAELISNMVRSTLFSRVGVEPGL